MAHIAKLKPALQTKIKDRRRKLKNRIHARRAASKREGKQHNMSGVNSGLEQESRRLTTENAQLKQNNRHLEMKSNELNMQVEGHDAEMELLARKLEELQAKVSQAQAQAQARVPRAPTAAFLHKPGGLRTAARQRHSTE